MSWETLLDSQKRLCHKLDFRDVHISNNLVDTAMAAMFALSENYSFNLVILEQGKTVEIRNFLEGLKTLNILGTDVLLYHDTGSQIDDVIKISSKQEFRRTELDVMAFSQRRPFVVISFNPEVNLDCAHLVRLLHFSPNFRGLLLMGDRVGQEFAFYA